MILSYMHQASITVWRETILQTIQSNLHKRIVRHGFFSPDPLPGLVISDLHAYKDVSDFYYCLDASKKAVELAPNDKIYWQNLTNIYELMDKKPLIKYCIKKTLELYAEEQKRIAESVLGQGNRLDSSTSLLEEKLASIPENIEPVDPFDDEAVALYNYHARKERIQNTNH